jgi:hypothetical protein
MFAAAKQVEPKASTDPHDPVQVAALLNYLVLHAQACEQAILNLASSIDELRGHDAEVSGP